jgi:predicted nucleic acid-binding protein
VRFWDSSALVPLCLDQPRSAEARTLAGEDAEMVVWWGSAIECASAIARLYRENLLTAAQERAARALLAELGASWFEVQPGSSLRDQAMRVLRLHPLRAADALQLAAALEWSGPAAGGVFVSFDDRLRSAAEREGFVTP